jgi:2-(1,2-epoxy-1,2-dihydrophenyl)acetyl-CoA isomerase
VPDVEGLQLRTEGQVRWIVFDRDARGNSLTPDMRNTVIDELSAASGDDEVRAVVLTAIGKRFCTGADITPRLDADGNRVEPGVGDVRRLIRSGAQRLVRAVWECDKPVVCGLNGTAAGLGAHLAMACDLVIAARSARFIEVFVRRGLLPDGGGAWLLPRLIGLQRAKELMFFGDDLSADDAERIGIVNRVVDDDSLEASVREWADRLAAGPTRALGFTKRLANTAFETTLDAHCDLEASFVEMNVSSEDQAEGIAAFMQKRDAQFRGR